MEENKMVTFNPSVCMDEIAVNLNPQNARGNITNIALILKAREGIGNALNLIQYRVLYDAYTDGIYTQSFKYDSKGNKVYYTSFEKWAKDNFNIERSTAYNAVKVGKFIKEDGTGTTLYRYPKQDRDYTFSALVAISECKDIYNIIVDDKGHEKSRSLKLTTAHIAALDNNNNIRREEKYDNNGVSIGLVPIFTDEEVNCTILEALCYELVITPFMSVKDIKKALKAHFTPEIILTDSTDEVNLTDSTDEVNLTDSTDELNLADSIGDVNLIDKLVKIKELAHKALLFDGNFNIEECLLEIIDIIDEG